MERIKISGLLGLGALVAFQASAVQAIPFTGQIRSIADVGNYVYQGW